MAVNARSARSGPAKNPPLLVALAGGRDGTADNSGSATTDPRGIFLRKVQPLLGRGTQGMEAELSFHERDGRGGERLRLKVIVELDRDTPMRDLREASLRAAAKLMQRAVEQSAKA